MMYRQTILRRVLLLLLCTALIAALSLPAAAANVSGDEAVETLMTLGLAKGTGAGFEPNRAPTRAEAAVMLLRLLGLEQTALEAGISSHFVDAGWADKYLGYAKTVGLVKGIGNGYFGSELPAGARDWATMVLRALGYTEGQDFTWLGSLEKAEELGLTHGEPLENTFLREDLALMSCTALGLKMRDGGRRLIDELYLRGAVSAEALRGTRFAGAINAGRPRYSAGELYHRSASAALYLEMFPDEAAMTAGKQDVIASGFLIAPDGLALVSWHQLDKARFARAYTTDGRCWDLDRVIWYDYLRDIAVVRLSMTDTEGRSTRAFPWLELGDSAALECGEAVYTIGAPLGQRFAMTDGIVSLPNCVVDDPAYPCILTTANISSGASGGVLLNAFGDAVGVVFGAFIAGDSMNLVTPLTCLAGVDLHGAGQTLSEVCDEMDALRDAAQLYGDRLELELAVEEEQSVLISTDWPGQPTLRAHIEDMSVVECRWESFATKRSVPLTIQGLEAGDTEVTVTLDDWDNEELDAPELVITVHVREAS